MAIEQLINTGLGVIGKPPWRGVRSLVVIGPPRSGTSMVAGVLHHLGLHMGQDARPPVYEDAALSAAFERGDDRQVRDIVARYLKAHGRFGWKRPASIEQLDRVHAVFGNPSYVFVFKDIFAIANRNRISMSSNVVDNLRKTAEQYLGAVAFIQKRRPHALLVSYEKAMRDRERFVSQVGDFCGLDVDAQRRDAAAAFMDPVPEDYLEKSRLHRAQGRLVGLDDEGQLRGWARYVYRKDARAVVDVYLNDKVVASVNAVETMAAADAACPGPCGFSFAFGGRRALRPGDVVRARVRGEIRDLDNSPIQV